MNIHYIHRINNQNITRTALLFNNTTITYGEMEKNIDKYAGYLGRMGLLAGDRVAIALPNCPEFIYSYFGIIRAGGTVVPLNLLQTPLELAFMLKDSGVSYLITNEAIGQALSQLPSRQSIRVVILNEQCSKEILNTPSTHFEKGIRNQYAHYYTPPALQEIPKLLC